MKTMVPSSTFPRLSPLATAIRRTLYCRIGLGTLVSLPGLTLAGPSGEHLVGGSAAVARPDARTTVIDQFSLNAVINWQSFSIRREERVDIHQPGATAALLNRVVGPDPSEIFGQINANGRVFLVNPGGVYFAPGARLDVGALAASTLDIRDAAFMHGNYIFAEADTVDASVVNAGEIRTADGGFVVLAGDYVANAGLIEARFGEVVLAAGSQLTLSLDDTGLVGFAVDRETVAAIAGAENLGHIIADGGRVLMTARLADQLAAAAVNNAGLIRARGIEEVDGAVYLRATGGDIAQRGSIDVSGDTEVTGGNVVLAGDRDIVVADGSVIHADGSAGGSVRLVAGDRLEFAETARITAEGADGTRRGGTVELSGRDGIRVRGAVDADGGEVVVDPFVLHVTSGGSSPQADASGFSGAVGAQWISSRLASNVSVTLVASGSIHSSGGSGFSIDAGTGGSADLSLRIGTVSAVSSGASLDGAQPGFSCGSFGAGVCSDAAGASGYAADNTTLFGGTINLPNVSIRINGDLTVNAISGVRLGELSIGGHVEVNNFLGEIRVGSAFASGDVRLLNSIGSGLDVGQVAAGGSVELKNFGGLVTGDDIFAVGNVNVSNFGSGIAIANLTAFGSASVSSFLGFVDIDHVSVGASVTMFAGSGLYVDQISAGGSASLHNLGGILVTGDIHTGSGIFVSNVLGSGLAVGNLSAGGSALVINGHGYLFAGDVTAGANVSIFNFSGAGLSIGNVNAGSSAFIANSHGVLRVGNVQAGIDVDLYNWNFNQGSAWISAGAISAGSDVFISNWSGSGVSVAGIAAAGAVDVYNSYGYVNVGDVAAGEYAWLVNWSGAGLNVGHVNAGSSAFLFNSFGELQVGGVQAGASIYMFNWNDVVLYATIDTGDLVAGTDVVIRNWSGSGLNVGNVAAGGAVDVFNSFGQISIGDISAGGYAWLTNWFGSGADFGDVAAGQWVEAFNLVGTLDIGDVSAGSHALITNWAGSGLAAGNVNTGDFAELFNFSGNIHVGNIGAGGSAFVTNWDGRGDVMLGNINTGGNVGIFNSSVGVIHTGDILAGDALRITNWNGSGMVTGDLSAADTVWLTSFAPADRSGIRTGAIETNRALLLMQGGDIETGGVSAASINLFAESNLVVMGAPIMAGAFTAFLPGTLDIRTTLGIGNNRADIEQAEEASQVNTGDDDLATSGDLAALGAVGAQPRAEVKESETEEQPDSRDLRTAPDDREIADIRDIALLSHDDPQLDLSGFDLIFGVDAEIASAEFYDHTLTRTGLAAGGLPNAVFLAPGGIDIDVLDFAGNDEPVTWFMTNGQTRVDAVTPDTLPDAVVVFSPIADEVTVSIENSVPQTAAPGVMHIGKQEHFDLWPDSATFIFGNGVPGVRALNTNNYVIGAQGTLNIGAQNLLIVTLGDVNTLANVITTGATGVFTLKLGDDLEDPDQDLQDSESDDAAEGSESDEEIEEGGTDASTLECPA